MLRLIAAIMALTAPVIAQAQTSRPLPAVGTRYEIVRVSETTGEDSRGSTSSSYDRDTLAARVIAVKADGLELEYDLPANTSPQDRARSWQFPARVFRPFDGPMRLLNRAELATRVESWLKAGGMTREACGRWIFTWNAFRIECDPESVLGTLAAFDLWWPDLRDGAAYREEGALASAPLRQRAKRSGGAIFTVELAIDPEAVRRQRADSDIVVAEINRKPLTAEAARRAHAGEGISGTVTIAFETGSDGQVLRRTRVVKVSIKLADGTVENRTVKETVDLRPVRAPFDERMVLSNEPTRAS